MRQSRPRSRQPARPFWPGGSGRSSSSIAPDGALSRVRMPCRWRRNKEPQAERGTVVGCRPELRTEWGLDPSRVGGALFVRGPVARGCDELLAVDEIHLKGEDAEEETSIRDF